MGLLSRNFSIVGLMEKGVDNDTIINKGYKKTNSLATFDAKKAWMDAQLAQAEQSSNPSKALSLCVDVANNCFPRMGTQEANDYFEHVTARHAAIS